jgi:hypothetical protein
VEHVEGRQDAGGQPSESEKIDQEREARERILDEFKQEFSPSSLSHTQHSQS